MKRFAAALAFAFASLAAFPAYATEVIRIVAAENFYGDIAAAVGGAHVRVTSILNNPDEDPHLFEASPSVARDLAAARIVVLNGADYDPWVAKLLSANAEAGRSTMVAADLVGRKPGDNPHLWYDPATMPTVAGALATALDAIDPANKADYDNNLKLLDASLQKIVDKVASIRARFEGAEVTATEPVFGYMAAALGLKVRNERFQLAVMNDTEPSARDTAAMEADLKGRRVKV